MSVPVDFAVFAAVFLFVGIGFVFALWFFYERREALLNDSRRIKTVFCCIKCGLIYERGRRRETSPCPHCGFNNSRLKF